MLGRIFGRYCIVSPLGEGGMATVWRAHDPLLEREVALKLLARELSQSAEARRRFRREADVAQLLDHPAITAVFDSGEDDGEAWLAMALVDGETLAERMTRGLMPLNECCATAAILASALGYAHARGVLHRDVSPRNIMLARDGRVFLLDFGLALLQGTSSMTRSGGLPGTLTYMAPEVLGGAVAEPRSDLYSLAAVVYEMVTGSPPHSAASPEPLIYAKLNVPARPAGERRPGVPGSLQSLLSRTLDRDPGARPVDAEEFLSTLRAAEVHAPAGVARQARAAGELLARGDGVVYLGVPAFEVDGAEEVELVTLAGSLAQALRRRLGVPRRLHVLQEASAPSADGGVLSWARQHGANLVLTCRVRRHGALARVECTILDPVGGVSLAGDTVDGSSFDPLELEDRVLECVRHLLPMAEHRLEDQRLNTDDPVALADRLGQALHYLQRHDHEPSVDAAMGLLERSAAARPDEAEIHAALARAYLAKLALTRQRAWEERAATAVHRAARIAPERPEVRLALAELKAATGHAAEAAELFRSALDEAPDRFDGWLGLARMHAGHGEFEEAEAACRRAISLRPRDWRGYSTLGTVYFKQGRYGLALAPLRRVLRLSPEQPRAESNLGAVLFHLDRFDESEAALRRSLRIEPSAATHANLGTLLYARHMFAEAVEEFDRACRLREADPRFWGYLGGAARQVPGMEERSARAYDRAIGLLRGQLERDPEDAENWAILSGWLAGNRQPEEARRAIERALSLAPGHMRCTIEAAHTYAQLGELDRALDHLAQAIQVGHGIREIERSVDLEPLRATERYRRLMEEAPNPSRPR